MPTLIPAIVTGDDVAFQLQLTKDENNFNIDSGATVKASLVSKDRKNIIVAPVSLTRVVVDPVSSAVLSDWPLSLVYVQFSSALTDAIEAKYYNTAALLEIQVDDSVNSVGKTTWFHKVKIVRGTIDQV